MVTTLRVGSVIKHYRITNLLGEGSSGQVFIASDPRGLPVVLKCIPLKTAWFQKEFEREVNSLSKCMDCKHIVKMHQYFKYKTYGVIILEKLRGDLLDYLQQRQPLEVDYVKTIFYQICYAVMQLHKRCIAHLDIKPENIFMATPNSVKLGDFGSSYHWQNDFESKLGAVGTSYYCAPEVGPSHPYNPRKADTWSLGILLHVLLTGFWPYKGKTEAALHENVKTGNTSIFIDSLPEDSALMDLLEGLLRHDSDLRFSIEQVLASEWLNTSTKQKRNLHGCSLPNLQVSVDEEFEDDEFEDNNDNNFNFEKPKQKHAMMDDNVPDVFDFSDDDDDCTQETPDFDDTWEMTPPSSVSHLDLQDDEIVLTNSLPQVLSAEPMKKPRTMVNVPNTSDNAFAAPINKGDKQPQRKRRRSLLGFFNSRKSRRSSAVDSDRRSGLSLNL